MPRKGRPLPEPPRGKRFGESAGGGELIFDKLQEAAAEGKLEKFIHDNIPGGGHAQKLTEMMMGMSGMPVTGMPPSGKPEAKAGGAAKEKVPTDVLQAVREGNVGALQGLLKREHEKHEVAAGTAAGVIAGGKGAKKKKGKAEDAMAGQVNAVQFTGSLVEKEVIDSLMEIAVDNGLQMDWLIMRALKLYVKKYQETGQL
ncbi:MAG: hypothetical protein M0018_01215 [Nitrospiraceae bacterium]|nr:hypothetical protein [Nitrospiraceae bacterium]